MESHIIKLSQEFGQLLRNQFEFFLALAGLNGRLPDIDLAYALVLPKNCFQQHRYPHTCPWLGQPVLESEEFLPRLRSPRTAP